MLELILIESFLHVRSGVGLIVVRVGRMSVNDIEVFQMFNKKSIVLQNTQFIMFVVSV